MGRASKIRFVCISDTHNHSPGEGYTLPPGDVLIHAGDFTNQGTLAELKKAAAWLEGLDFPVKIIVAGNHDLALDATYQEASSASTSDLSPNKHANAEDARAIFTSIPGVHYLEHTSAEICIPTSSNTSSSSLQDVKLRVFGSPFSVARISPGNARWAFQYLPQNAAEVWSTIPLDTDLLITHTPPATIRDSSAHWIEGGCAALAERLEKVRPPLMICGHCHEGRGAEVVKWGEKGGIQERRGWEDPGIGNKKWSVVDLTERSKDGQLKRGMETAVVNASVKAGMGKERTFRNKPIVVDVDTDLLRNLGRVED